MSKMFVVLRCISCVSACRSETAVPIVQNTASQSVVNSSDASNTTKTPVGKSSTETVSDGEITGCALENFGRGAKLVVSLKTPHGGYLAIEREGKNPDYFLLSEPARRPIELGRHSDIDDAVTARKLSENNYAEKKYILLSELDLDELVEAGKKAGADPFYAASEFAKLDQLKINTAEATTVDVEKNKADGKYQLERIFSAP